MGYTIIHKKDKEKMADMVEDILYTAGRLMSCVEELEDSSMMGERSYPDGMGMRDGGRMPNAGWEAPVSCPLYLQSKSRCKAINRVPITFYLHRKSWVNQNNLSICTTSSRKSSGRT